jgi:hypothetical protein
VPFLLEALSASVTAAPRTMLRVAFADEVRTTTTGKAFDDDAHEIRKPGSIVSAVPSSSSLRIRPASLGDAVNNSAVPAPVPVTTDDEDLVSLGSYACAFHQPLQQDGPQERERAPERRWRLMVHPSREQSHQGHAAVRIYWRARQCSQSEAAAAVLRLRHTVWTMGPRRGGESCRRGVGGRDPPVCWQRGEAPS